MWCWLGFVGRVFSDTPTHKLFVHVSWERTTRTTCVAWRKASWGSKATPENAQQKLAWVREEHIFPPGPSSPRASSENHGFTIKYVRKPPPWWEALETRHESCTWRLGINQMYDVWVHRAWQAETGPRTKRLKKGTKGIWTTTKTL